MLMDPGHSDLTSCHRQVLVPAASAHKQQGNESLLQLARVQNSARGEQVGNGSILHLRKQPGRARWHPRITEPPAGLEIKFITSFPPCSSAITIIAGQFYTTSTQGSFWLREFKRLNQQLNNHHYKKELIVCTEQREALSAFDSCSSTLGGRWDGVLQTPIGPAVQTILPSHTYFHSKNHW